MNTGSIPEVEIYPDYSWPRERRDWRLEGAEAKARRVCWERPASNGRALEERRFRENNASLLVLLLFFFFLRFQDVSRLHFCEAKRLLIFKKLTRIGHWSCVGSIRANNKMPTTTCFCKLFNFWTPLNVDLSQTPFKLGHFFFLKLTFIIISRKRQNRSTTY